MRLPRVAQVPVGRALAAAEQRVVPVGGELVELGDGAGSRPNGSIPQARANSSTVSALTAHDGT